MNKYVLFISYHFPPDASVGALRAQKFVKYLPEFGWKPFVLAVKEHHYTSIDKGRLKDVRGAVVERTSFWRTPLQLFIDLRDGFRTTKKTPIVSSPSAGATPRLATNASCKGLKRWLFSLNWFPDDKLYWLFPALRKGLTLIRTHDIRHIVVSTPPHSAILIAYLLSRLTGAKLIIDFRDPWLLRHGYSLDAFKPQRLLDVELKLQARILRHAAAVVTTNDFFRSALLNEYDFLSPERVHVVHNGCDLADFPPVLQREEKRVFSISYLGTFYMQRNPENFLRALALFMDEQGLSSTDVKVRFVGDTESASGSPVRAMIEHNELRDVVSISAKVDYAQALEIMCESSVLLLLAPGQPYQIPAKTYEYMAAGRPVLALTEAGATAALIASMGCGISVEPSDIEGIRHALTRLYDDHLSGTHGYVHDVSFFERRNQTSLLAGILDRINAA
jgi:glycosyltransferase involved in cell wall biosynthesis